MLPGSPVQPPPLPVLVGLSSVPIPSPSGPQSLSISSSLAIVVIIIIAAAIVTICIVLLRRGCHHHSLSCSTLSPRHSFSPLSGMPCGESAGVCALPRTKAGMPSSLEMVVVPSAPKEAGNALASASVSRSAERLATETFVPSAPPLREVLHFILASPELHAPGKSADCLICSRKSPNDVTIILPGCSHVFHQSCIVRRLLCTTMPCCPFCSEVINVAGPYKTNFCLDGYDMESQMLVMAKPGEELAESVGGIRGWLRSCLDRLSGSLIGFSRYCSDTVALPVYAKPITETMASGDHSSMGSQSRMWDVESATPMPEKPSVFDSIGSTELKQAKNQREKCTYEIQNTSESQIIFFRIGDTDRSKSVHC